MIEWKIRVAKNLKDLEKLVEKIQLEGWTIDKIDVKSVSVVAYKAKNKAPELLNEQQDEGWVHVNKDYPSGFEWDRGDYGQQNI